MATTAIILAGGSGQRINKSIPKQLIEVLFRPMICYTIEAFEQSPLIDNICIVCKADIIDNIRQIVDKYSYRKVTDIIEGGAERFHSSIAALKVCKNENDKVLIHDGARPLVSEKIIANCVMALDYCNAAGVAVPATNTIWQSLDKSTLTSTPPRQTMFEAQTPQAFRLKTIKEAYLLALADPEFTATDDCGVVNKYLPQEPIKIIIGDSENIKITYPQDFSLMQSILESRLAQSL